MTRLEGWGFLCLIGCAVTVTLSLSLLSGGWQVGGTLAGVVIGVLAGGLYAASARPPADLDAEPTAPADGRGPVGCSWVNALAAPAAVELFRSSTQSTRG
jgi:hypothetical protein